jgi:hypothetical protein
VRKELFEVQSNSKKSDFDPDVISANKLLKSDYQTPPEVPRVFFKDFLHGVARLR